MIVDVGYFGSKGTHLLGIVDLNLVPPGLAANGVNQVITAGNTAALLNRFRPFRGLLRSTRAELLQLQLPFSTDGHGSGSPAVHWLKWRTPSRTI